MLPLLEHQAKALLGGAGFEVPAGATLTRIGELPRVIEVVDGPPWMVKAQIHATSRAALGGILEVRSPEELRGHVDALLGAHLGGKVCRSVLVEQFVAPTAEWFLGVLLDPHGKGLLVTCSPDGGSGIEEAGRRSGLDVVAFTPDHPPDPAVLAREWATIDGLPDVVASAASRLCHFAVAHDALLVEINPLGITATGRAIALDAHMTVDESASYRQPWFQAYADELSAFLPGFAWQTRWGGHFIVMDPAGEVATINTGAGAGMLIVDELERRGIKSFNFSDIRAGSLAAHPDRIGAVVDRVLEAERVRAVLVNIHAGITDCRAVLPLLIQAAERCSPTAHVIVRLAGRGSEDARRAMAVHGVRVTESLEEALDMIVDVSSQAVP